MSQKKEATSKNYFIYGNQVFKSQIIEKVEKEEQQNNMIRVDDRRYVFDSYECLNIFRKLKSVYSSNNRALFFILLL